MSEEKDYDILKKLGPGKVILPILIGLAVVLWLMFREVNIVAIREISFVWASVFWLFVAILLIVVRTFSYMARIRSLTDNELTWIQSFRIIMLWEFTSAITPSTVGGTAFAVIFLHKEGISTGRSTSVVLVTSFLDELYFVIMFPLLLIILGGKSLFITSQATGTTLMNNLVFVAALGYLIILAWVLIVGYGLFFKPEAISNLIINVFRLPVIRRWRPAAIKAGDDIISSSKDLKNKGAGFWWRATYHTFISWTSRYLIVNAILLAFFSIGDHMLIFARQLVLWIIMIVSPSPGGSGFAEVILGSYISDLIPVDAVHARSISLTVAVIWRIITYYPFLIAGVFIVPSWIRRKFAKPVVRQ